MAWVKRRSQLSVKSATIPIFLLIVPIYRFLLHAFADLIVDPTFFSSFSSYFFFFFLFWYFLFLSIWQFLLFVCFSTRRGSGFRTRSRTPRRCSAWIISSRSSTSPPAKTPVSIDRTRSTDRAKPLRSFSTWRPAFARHGVSLYCIFLLSPSFDRFIFLFGRLKRLTILDWIAHEMIISNFRVWPSYWG